MLIIKYPDLTEEELWKPYVKKLDSALIHWGPPQYDAHQLPCYSIDDLLENICWLRKYIPEEELNQPPLNIDTPKAEPPQIDTSASNDKTEEETSHLEIDSTMFSKREVPYSSGAYGDVYKGVYNGKEVVVKVLERANKTDFENEARIMRYLNNTLPLIDLVNVIAQG